jgi:opacity protein-like surface antigen
MIKGIDMRKLALMAVLASTALAAPAMARDKAWYVGVEGGGMIVQDIKFRVFGVKNAVNADMKTGYDIDGIIGYDFGMFRLEGEVAKKHSSVKSITNNSPAGFNNATGTFDAAGVVGIWTFMGNALLDFGPDDGLNGYVGGGAGVARTKFSGIAAGPTGPIVDESDTRVFAIRSAPMWISG